MSLVVKDIFGQRYLSRETPSQQKRRQLFQIKVPKHKPNLPMTLKKTHEDTKSPKRQQQISLPQRQLPKIEKNIDLPPTTMVIFSHNEINPQYPSWLPSTPTPTEQRFKQPTPPTPPPPSSSTQSNDRPSRPFIMSKQSRALAKAYKKPIVSMRV
mmetsp:Transcript_8478/g.12516  ORF Transcript_8478/g.12516 Transcript_8478/m.12516 type:complete len:155 (-) Transcript_8478:19-483(-)